MGRTDQHITNHQKSPITKNHPIIQPLCTLHNLIATARRIARRASVVDAWWGAVAQWLALADCRYPLTVRSHQPTMLETEGQRGSHDLSNGNIGDQRRETMRGGWKGASVPVRQGQDVPAICSSLVAAICSSLRVPRPSVGIGEALHSWILQ